MSNYILKSFINSPVIRSNSYNTIYNNSEIVKGRILVAREIRLEHCYLS